MLMKNNKTSYIKVRMTPEEVIRYKEKATSYPNFSDYVRAALDEFSHVNAKQKIELIKELISLYQKYKVDFSHLGGNLNQSVKLANELNKGGKLQPEHMTGILSVLNKWQKIMMDIGKNLKYLMLKAGRQ